MAIVKLITEEEATGKVREVFEEIKATKEIIALAVSITNSCVY